MDKLKEFLMKILFTILVFLFTKSAIGQVNLDSAKMYHYFDTMGMTTASSYGQFTRMSNENCPFSWLSNEELNEFISILNRSDSKKHIQTKIGQLNIFILGYIEGKEQRIVIANQDLIIDHGNGRQYKVDSDDQEKLNLILSRRRK